MRLFGKLSRRAKKKNSLLEKGGERTVPMGLLKSFGKGEGKERRKKGWGKSICF